VWLTKKSSYSCLLFSWCGLFLMVWDSYFSTLDIVSLLKIVRYSYSFKNIFMLLVVIRDWDWLVERGEIMIVFKDILVKNELKRKVGCYNIGGGVSIFLVDGFGWVKRLIYSINWYFP